MPTREQASRAQADRGTLQYRMHPKLIESIRAISEMAERERLLRRTLMAVQLSESELEALKADRFIQRHLSLLSVIQDHQQDREFRVAQTKWENESMFKKLLRAIFGV